VATFVAAIVGVYGLALAGAYDLNQFRPSRIAGTISGNLGVAPDPRGAVVAFRAGSALLNLTGHDAPIVSADPVLEGSAILTSAADGSIRLTRTNPTEILRTITAPRLSSAAHDRLWVPYGALPTSLAMQLEGRVRQMAQQGFRATASERTWEKIDCETLSTDANRSVIKVADGQALDAVRFEIHNSDVYVRSVRVRYITGNSESHDMDWMAPRESRTNAIILQSGERGIRQFELSVQPTTRGGVVEICAERSASIALFDNWNEQAVDNNPTGPTQFTIKNDYLVTYIANYHWNNGQGMARGEISLRDQNGKVHGPWKVVTSSGQDGKPNVNWECKPSIKIPAGTYTVMDSDVASWSQNEKSGRVGMSRVKGYPAS
jgi:hypothetical protein